MDDDFEIANDIIPKIQVKTGDEVQKFHGTWYRGKNINFIPSKNLLSKKDAFEKFILRGYKPNLPIISKSTVVTAFGSCFAHNISNWLLNHGYNILGKKLSLNSHLVRFGEGIVNTFAILEQLEWALENKSLHKGLWFGKNKEIALPDDDIKNNTKELLLQSKVLIITVGLSEIWYDKKSGRAFWRAIPATEFDDNRHGFRLTTVKENSNNLNSIVRLIKKYNPNCKIVFTLSPIPLMATFRNINCISANSISKSILRVALDNLTYGDEFGVYYFPSYELVKEVFNNPFMNDNRHVKPEYTNLIMEVFAKHFCK